MFLAVFFVLIVIGVCTLFFIILSSNVSSDAPTSQYNKVFLSNRQIFGCRSIFKEYQRTKELVIVVSFVLDSDVSYR